MNNFLDNHPGEIILISAKKGRMSKQLDDRHQDVLAGEDTDPERVPGQMVHQEVEAALGGKLATYQTLSRLPGNASWENPGVSELVGINVRAIYFWETQQVLCTGRNSCEQTPGW